MARTLLASLPFLLVACGPAQAEPRLISARDVHVAKLQSLPTSVGGRVVRQTHDFLRQWPGTYFETAFIGRSAVFDVGEGDVVLHVLVDDQPVKTLTRPKGTYRIEGLRPGRHTLRVEVATESQAGPTAFGGFYADRRVKPLAATHRNRQIEFIGDSHTVGYGNSSAKKECTEQEVWATTDTSRAFGPLLARRYAADYQVNAISGRGVVRNYDGMQVDTLPAAYPYSLFDKREPYRVGNWRPQVIVISLGTNDFSTPLHQGEKWRSREDLRADFEASYVRFVQELRARNRDATFILWATDTANGEVASEVQRVFERLKRGGEKRVEYALMPKLEFSGCHSHPSVADDRTIAGRLEAIVDATPEIWKR